ncbi:MAG: enoyl-CoA hydratase-related protein [Hyphomonadaceae bacterium]
MPKFIQMAKENHTLTITINRPEVRNALNAEACFELSDAWTAYQADPDLWVAIVTAAGDTAFCGGHDLGEDVLTPLPKTGWAGLVDRTDITKPIIAAVNGMAYGGGFELVLAADIVIADERAKFAMSEPRVGFFAGGGGAERLALRMPSAIAMGLLLTGKPILAAEAHRWGLVNEVAPAGQTMAVARKWAGDIMECAPFALQCTKEIAMAALEWRDMRRAVAERQRDLMKALVKLDDTREGTEAFYAKRKPVWTNR